MTEIKNVVVVGGGFAGIGASRPFVGNNLWVTSLTDPDGYRLDFESPTDVPEETVYTERA